MVVERIGSGGLELGAVFAAFTLDLSFFVPY
jgi:hypothetical protein